MAIIRSITDYAARASAVRGAKRQGVEVVEIITTEDNRFAYTYDDGVAEVVANVEMADEIEMPTEAEVIESNEAPAPVALVSGDTKKGQVLSMLQAQEMQIPQIAAALSIGNTAARSLIGDLQRAGYTLTVVRKAGERLGYYRAG